MPIVFEQDLGNETNLAIWKIEESAEQLECQLQLKQHEINFLKSLQGQKRNLEWLATRVLLRKMLATEEYIDVCTDEHGKPYLTNQSHHISLSHSFEYASVMISKKRRVGVDIELIKPKIEKIAHKFLSDIELAFIDHENKLAHLYVCWCAKEALYKLNGQRETSFKENIHINPFVISNEGYLNASINKNSQNESFMVHYKTIGSYMLGFVVDKPMY